MSRPKSLAHLWDDPDDAAIVIVACPSCGGSVRVDSLVLEAVAALNARLATLPGAEPIDTASLIIRCEPCSQTQRAAERMADAAAHRALDRIRNGARPIAEVVQDLITAGHARALNEAMAEGRQFSEPPGAGEEN